MYLIISISLYVPGKQGHVCCILAWPPVPGTSKAFNTHIRNVSIITMTWAFTWFLENNLFVDVDQHVYSVMKGILYITWHMLTSSHYIVNFHFFRFIKHKWGQNTLPLISLLSRRAWYKVSCKLFPIETDVEIFLHQMKLLIWE